jgi:CRISPR-associated protein Cmr3
MSVWLIEPLDPLIARDGRPAAVGRFDTVGFPFPSMVAGAVRTRMGSVGGAFSIPRGNLEELKDKIPVQGPLLAELDAGSGGICQWLAPAPRDAVYVQTDGGGPLLLKRLTPRPFAPGEAADSFAEKSLLPVTVAGEAPRGKPPDKVPAFWDWSHYEAWLKEPADASGESPFDRGIEKLPVEKRAHLAIQRDERVGIDGMLFQTAGLRFLQKGASRLQPRRFALSLRCQGAPVAGRPLELKPQVAPLGGERRLARWMPAAAEWPVLPAEVRESIAVHRRARLVLLTPAIFTQGALPGWSGHPWLGEGPVRATVRAACVPRPEVVSGWDLANGEAKPSRRMAPAGSVFFLALDGSEDDLRAWCGKVWLSCVSDDWNERRDGFGLAALGTWEDAP